MFPFRPSFRHEFGLQLLVWVVYFVFDYLAYASYHKGAGLFMVMFACSAPPCWEITTRHTIGYYEELLPSRQFVRIHCSFSVGTTHIKSIPESQIRVGSQTLPIRRNYRLQVFQKLNIRDFIRQLPGPVFQTYVVH